MNFLVVTLASIGVLLVMQGITFAVGRRIGRYNVVDVTWGLGFVGVAAVAAVLGAVLLRESRPAARLELAPETGTGGGRA